MVGERIRYYRKRQKMTLRELGEKSGFENRGDVRIAQFPAFFDLEDKQW